MSVNDGIGKLSVLGNFVLNGSGLFQVKGKDVAGTDFDQIDVTGSVTVGSGASLSVTAVNDYALNANIISLVSNDGSDAVVNNSSVLVTNALLTGNYLLNMGGGSNANDITVQGNRPPTLAVTGATLAEGATFTLATGNLSASDPENSTAAQLVYTVTTATAHGTLFKDSNGNGTVDGGEALGLNATFTQADIDAGRVKYLHDGSETTADSLTLTVTDKDGVSLTGQVLSLTVTPVNDAPVLGGYGNQLAYTENGEGVTINASATLSDIEIGDGYFNNGTLTVQRQGTADGTDLFGAGGLVGPLVTGNDVTVDGTRIGTVTRNNGGVLSITFSGDNKASRALVQQLLRSLTYASSSENPPPSVALVTTLSDGNSGAQGSGGAMSGSATTTIVITSVNDQPSSISLSSAQISEQAARAGGTVGTFTTTDLDGTGSEIYTITGGNSAGFFAISGNSLVTRGTVLAGTYVLDVMVDDGGVPSQTTTRQFTITVADDIAPSGYGVTLSDTLVGAADRGSLTATLSGAEVGTTYSYTLTSAGGGSVTGTGTVTAANQSIALGDLSGLGDGALTLSVVLTDKAGNAGVAATATSTLDATAPGGSLAFNDTLLNATEARNAAVTLTGAVVGDSYTYTVTSSGGGTVTGSGTWTSANGSLSLGDLSGLGDGTLTITLDQTDPAGNKGAALTATATLDKTLPAGAVSVSGSLLNATQARNVLLQAADVKAGGLYTYTVTSSGGGSVTGSGTWAAENTTVSLGDLSGLGDGTLTITVQQTDLAGNQGATLTTTATLDKTPPTGSISLSSPVLNASQARAVLLQGSGVKAGDSYSYTVTSSGGGTVTGSGTWTADNGSIALGDLSGLGDGTLTVTLVQTDSAGNQGTALAATATLDKTVPTGGITMADSLLNATEAKAASLSFTGVTAGDSYTYTITSSGGGTVTGSGTWTAGSGSLALPDLSGLGDGTLTISLEQTDSAGNKGAALTATATLDKTPPTGSIGFNSTVIGAGQAGSAGITLTSSEPGSRYSYTITSSGGGTPVTGTGNLTGTSGSLTLPDLSGLGDGTLTLVVEFTDAGGNTAPALTATALLDLVPNTVGLTLDPASDTGVVGDGITSQRQPTVLVNAPQGSSVDIDWGDGRGFVSVGTGTGAPQSVTLDQPYGSFGARTLQVRVTEPGGTTSLSSPLTLTLVPTPPTLGEITPVTVAEDSGTTSIPLPLTSPDTPVAQLGFTVSSSNPALANAAIRIVDGVATLDIQPQPDAFGTAQITLTITGPDGASLTRTVSFTATDVNDAPVATIGSTDARAVQNQPFSMDLPAGTFADADIRTGGSDRLTYSLSGPAWLSIDPATGTLSGTPGQGDTGNQTAIITATDTAGLSAAITVNLTVSISNTAPVANNDSGSISELDTLEASVLANDTDADAGDVLTVTAVNGTSAVGTPVTLASGARVTVFADGTYRYDPNGAFGSLNNGQTATDSFTYTATDRAGFSDTGTVTITITGINNEPVTEPPKQVTIGRNTDAVGLSIDLPTDPDGDPLTIIITGLPGNGVTLRGDGSPVTVGDSLTPEELTRLQFDVDTGFLGEAGSLTYTISDGSSLRSGSVEILVAEEQIIGIRNADGSASVQAEPLPGGITRFSFEIYRTAGADPATTGTVTIDYRVEIGQGINAADFAGTVLPSGTVTLAPGESSRVITIDVVADGITEGDETFTVALENLRNQGLTLTPRVNDPSTVSATILDRDQDRTPPRVTAVTPPAAGSYFPGDNLSVTLTFSETVIVTNGATIPLLVGSTVRLATYTAGSGSNSLTFTYAVQEGDVDRDGITIGTQLGGTVKDAAGNNAVTSFALRNSSGTPIDLSAVLVNTVRGKTIDGYIQGALVFADANRNGVLDAGEVNVVTDAAGNYEIGGGSGPYIMVGGRDVSTGITFDGIYAAPPRATVINPLTTAIVGTAGLSADNAAFSTAEARLKAVLGIDAGLDLFNTDPIEAATAPGASAATIAAALDAQAEAGKLSILLVQGSALLTGAASTPLAAGAAGNAITAAIGDAVNARPAGSLLNMADQATISAILTDAANRLGITLPTGLLSGTAQLIGAANDRVETAQNGSGTALDRLTAMARVQVVAQGDATLAIRNGVTAGDLATALNGFTGTNLDLAIAGAQVGTIVPARITVTALDTSLSEGDTGTTPFRFQVTRTGSLFGSTSIDWSVSGDGGLDAADFGGKLPTGTITFADGESVKTITIEVTGDTSIEADERFTLTLSNASNGADIRTPTVSATIIDDDPRNPTYAGPDSIAALGGISTPVTGISILDGDSDQITITLTPTGATLALIGQASVGTANGVTTVTGTVEAVNATLASLVLTPTAGSTGGSLRVTASDGDASTADLDKTIAIRVAQSPENRLPVQPVVVGGVATEIIGIGVRDADSPTLSVTLTPTNGSVSLRTFGTAVATYDANGTLYLTGATADVNASLATVDFTALKTVRTATLRITTDDHDSVTPNDSDLILIQVVQAPAITLPPRAQVVAGTGTAISGISVADADADSLSVTLTPGNGSIALTAAGSTLVADAGNGALRVTGTVAEVNSTLASLRFTANGNASTATLRLQVVDNDPRTADPDQTLTIQVSAQPTLTLTSPAAIRPGLAGAVPGISVADRDSPTLSVTLTPSSGTLGFTAATGVTSSRGANGILTLSGTTAAINSTLASLTLTLPAGTQTASIAVSANDGTTPSVTGTLTIPVITNQPPVATANPLSLADGRVGAGYSAVLPGNLFTDPDAGDSLTLSVSGLPQGLTFDAATGTIRGIPDFNVLGTWTLTITATDRMGEKATRTTTLTIGQDNVAVLPTPSLPDTSLPGFNTTIAPPMLVAPAADTGPDPLSFGAKPIIVAGIGNSRGLFGDALEPARIDGINLRIGEPEGFVAVNTAAPGARPFLRIGNAEPTGRLVLDPATRTASFTLPAGTFVTNDGRLTVAAGLPGGKALPAWLRFDARTGTFFLRDAPPADAPARLVIEVTARTSDGQQQTVRLTLRLSDRTAGIDLPAGKVALSNAIRAAATTAIHDDGSALLRSLSALPATNTPSNAA